MGREFMALIFHPFGPVGGRAEIESAMIKGRYIDEEHLRRQMLWQ
jgi:hypothetical protein